LKANKAFAHYAGKIFPKKGLVLLFLKPCLIGKDVGFFNIKKFKGKRGVSAKLAKREFTLENNP